MTPPSLPRVESLIKERLNTHPGHPFFVFAKLQTSLIRTNLNTSGQVEKVFYDKLGLGLLCARELESTDMDFCNAVYCMLVDIGPK